MRLLCAVVASALLTGVSLRAQDNYEIQVYGSETVAPGRTMFETHTNFTFAGSRERNGTVLPTNHAVHETVEITHGWNNWFETGFYVFTSYNPGYGWQWVGDHIRPRVRVPDSWKWPVGASLSAEFGYQRSAFSQDTWSLELRPIVDKELGRYYLCFNPTLERSVHGPGVHDGVTFSPNAKFAYDVTKRVKAGFEYYGGLGPFNHWSPFNAQEQQFMPALDLDLGPDWEFNVGVGVGVTHSTDHLLVKMIIGRRFGFGSRKAKATGRDSIPANGPDANAKL